MKRPNIIRPVKLNTALPENVWLMMTTYLYSPAEGRVPHGAYSQFLTERIVEFFARQSKEAESNAQPGNAEQVQ